MPKTDPTSVLEIRRTKLRALMKERGGPGAFAKQIGKSGSYVSQLIGDNPRRPVTEATAREIEATLDLPIGYLDQPDSSLPGNRQLPPLVTDVMLLVWTIRDESYKNVHRDKIAEVVALAYERAAATGQIDEAYVRRLFKLME